MPKDIEELKMIVDLAKSDGKKEDENEMLKTVKKQLEDTCAKQQKMLAQKDKQLAEKDKRIEEQKERISELEAMVANKPYVGDGQQPVVFVNQYFLLDCPKTISYVGALDNSMKMFAGHLLLHTMADNTPKRVFDQVNEMTQLEGNSTDRLIDAMEKVAERPVTQENYYGDNVKEKTVIPSVENYQPQIQSQTNNLSPIMSGQQNLLEDE